jgi:hypothetical protein
MALWKWNGYEYLKAPLHSVSTGNLKAMLYGTGESLKEADKSPKGYMRFCINYAYKEVDPHYFIGMDDPNKFGRELMEMPFRKVFSGGYANIKVDGIAAKEYPETYFADIQSDSRGSIFFNRGVDCNFFFSKKTMFVALHLIMYMGFKHIAFSGVDLGGDYFYNQKLNDAEKKTLEEEFIFMKWFAEACPKANVTLENTSKVSRLNEILKPGAGKDAVPNVSPSE